MEKFQILAGKQSELGRPYFHQLVKDPHPSEICRKFIYIKGDINEDEIFILTRISQNRFCLGH